MKKLAFSLLIAASFGACKKPENTTPNNNSNNNPVVNADYNTITITDNGNMYKAVGYDNGIVADSTVWGLLDISSDPNYGSHFSLVVEGEKMPFKMQISFNKGAADGLGSYKAYSTLQKLDSYYDKQTYIAADSSSAIITSIDEKERIKGTFYVRFSNGAGKKIVTGTFDFDN